MKKLIYIIPMLAFAFTTAQTDPVQPPVAAPQKDTVTVNRQLQKQSDMKTMDAVKTQDHQKVTPPTTKDTVRSKKHKKNMRSH